MASTSEAAAVGLLTKVPIFAPLGEKTLKKLAASSKERSYAPGEKVVSRGEKGVGFFLILDGKVEVRKGDQTLASLGPSQFFGEMALLDDEPRTADVVAVVATRCLVVSKWEFWGFLADKPEMIRLLLQETVRRLRTSSGTFTE